MADLRGTLGERLNYGNKFDIFLIHSTFYTFIKNARMKKKKTTILGCILRYSRHFVVEFSEAGSFFMLQKSFLIEFKPNVSPTIIINCNVTKKNSLKC